MEHNAPVTVNETSENTHTEHAPKHHVTYDSNPFKAVITGIITLFKANPFPSILIGLVLGVSAFAAVLVAIGICFIYPPFGTIIGILLIFTIVIVYMPLANGAYHTLALSSLKGEKAKTTVFIKAAYKKLFPLLGASILIGLATFGGFLLFIVPGIIFSTWFSLTFFVMFDENLGAVAAMKRSKELVTGHVIEMIGATAAGAILNGLSSGASGGLLGPVITIAPMATRYSELKALKASSQPKPKVHWLNYLAIGAYIFFILIIIGYNALMIATGTLDEQGRRRNDRYSPPIQRHLDDGFDPAPSRYNDSYQNTLTN